MPYERFIALYNVIPALEAEELLRDTESRAYASNPGEKGRVLSDYLKRLRKLIGRKQVPKSTVVAGVTPLTEVVEPGTISVIRERQKQAALKLEEERLKNAY